MGQNYTAVIQKLEKLENCGMVKLTVFEAEKVVPVG